MEIIGLKGEKVRLVPPDRTLHFENALRWINDPEITDTLHLNFGVTRKQEEEWFDRIERERERDVTWAIHAEGRHVGFCGLHGIHWVNRYATGGLMIGDREAWGKGYGTDAVRTRLRFAFDQMGLHRVQGETYAFNTAMQRIYERCGYTREGTARQRIWRRGRWWDAYHYGVLAEEYVERQR